MRKTQIPGGGYSPCEKPARRRMIFILALCLWGILLAGPGLPAQVPGSENSAASELRGTAWIIPIRGDIDPSQVAFVRRETRRAEDQGAAFIIFEIDTFGGRVDSALQIASSIMSIKTARTVAWVSTNADSMGISWSAGALIAFSCTDIYMAAGTSVGAAAPVIVVSRGESEGAGEKAVAAVRSQMAALAERNGHPVGIALAMVDYDVELWEAVVNDRTKALTITELERFEREGAAVERISMISPPGKLLSLTSGDAYRYGLCAGIADSREILLESLHAQAVAEESVPGFSDTFISLLTSAPVQVILIILGLVMIFLEINTPGFGIPGLVAILSFAAVFGSGALLGRVGSLEVILFLAGVGLLAVEIFILPGFGIVGLSGFICIGLSLILSMQDFIIPRFDWEWDILGRNAVVVCIGSIAAVTGIALIALMGPRIRLFDGLTLHTRITGTAGGPVPDDAPPLPVNRKRSQRRAVGPVQESGTGEEQGYASLTGKTGRAASTLRPSGKADIDGRLYAVETEGVYLASGEPLRVIRVLGNRVIVEKTVPLSTAQDEQGS